MFYTSLGRLLMVDLGEDEDKFEAFMIPLTTAFESLGQVRLLGLNNLGFKKNTQGFFLPVFCFYPGVFSFS
jgi:hypothetical protein